MSPHMQWVCQKTHCTHNRSELKLLVLHCMLPNQTGEYQNPIQRELCQTKPLHTCSTIGHCHNNTKAHAQTHTHTLAQGATWMRSRNVMTTRATIQNQTTQTTTGNNDKGASTLALQRPLHDPMRSGDKVGDVCFAPFTQLGHVCI